MSVVTRANVVKAEEVGFHKLERSESSKGKNMFRIEHHILISEGTGER
jgi:hypothetical protein